jgi:phage terminase large subunit GpA-like protein
MLSKAQQRLNPPPTLTISQWADAERVLSPEASSEPGRWNTDRAEYLRGPLDAAGDPAIPVVVVMKASQCGGTEIINNVVGYHIHQDPAIMLVIQPTLDAAETWSKDRLAPMLRDVTALRDRVHDPRSRDSDNTLRQKIYPGGRLTIVGANAPTGLAMRPIRIVLADEVDRYGLSAGTEGDPLSLADKRQQTFWNRKTVLISTPLDEQTSRILVEWRRSDMRRYHVPCKDCGFEQHLKWASVRWDKSESGEHQPGTAHYVCENCGSIWNDADRWDAIKRGRWIAERTFHGVAGFHIPGMLSSWKTLTEIVAEFLEVRKDPERLKPWTNTVLGDPWEETVDKIEGSSLTHRGENYGPLSLPDEIRIITAGVDVQHNRLEVQTIGWGPGEESWVIEYEIFHGDTAQADVWDLLDKFLMRTGIDDSPKPYQTELGRELRIRAACIDCGDQQINAGLVFCKRRQKRRIYAIRGRAGAYPIWPKRSSLTKGNDQIFLIGVDTAKEAIYGRLKIEREGRGYVHFPLDDAINDEYFEQLTSEQIVTRRKEGVAHRVWVPIKGRRNEALDTFVYALAARSSQPLWLTNARGELPQRTQQLPDNAPSPEFGSSRQPDAAPAAAPPPPPAQSNDGGWFDVGRDWL